jgi:Trk-type K+ transport system membrane component
MSERDQANLDIPALPWRSFLTREVTGRNAQFYGLTYEERESLGGVEYRALRFLSWIVPIYVVVWQFLGCLSLGAWMAYNAADITQANGINPWYACSPRTQYDTPSNLSSNHRRWNGAFNAVSAFNNSGMSLLDLNMVIHL